MILRNEKEIIDRWNKQDKPLVTIACVTYNHENYIEECLIGFLIQETEFPFEIIIHDDASTDKTVEIVKNYQKLYPKIVFPLLQKVNQYSQSIKPNTIIFNKARGDLIAFCDGDDFWSSSKKIQIQVEYMNSYKDCDVSFHGVNVIHANKANEEKLSIHKPYIYSLEQIISKDHKLVFSSSSIMIRYNVIRNLPKFYYIAPVEDYYLRILGAIRGGGVYIPEILSSYRRFTPNSFTLKFKRSPEIALKNLQAMKEVKIYLKKSFFSMVGFKVIHFYLKYLILRIVDSLKN